jgi:hypothetical protein
MQRKFTVFLAARVDMSQMFVTEFNESEAAVQHDLLARLYHEIGLSAVAAALDVMNAPSALGAPAAASPGADPRYLPAFLREDDLAA